MARSPSSLLSARPSWVRKPATRLWWRYQQACLNSAWKVWNYNAWKAWRSNEDYGGIIRKYCGILEYREWLKNSHSLFRKCFILWILGFCKRLRNILCYLIYILTYFFCNFAVGIAQGMCFPIMIIDTIKMMIYIQWWWYKLKNSTNHTKSKWDT